MNPDGWVTAAQVQTATAGTSTDDAAAAATFAASVLFALSGRRWPGRTQTALRAPFRPGRRCLLGRSYGGYGGCSSRDLDPGLTPLLEVLAPGVVVGDVTVPVDQLEIVDGLLVRLPTAAGLSGQAVNRDPLTGVPLGPWGSCCGGVGWADLTVAWGADPPAEGQAAALALALDAVKALAGKACQINGNVTSVQRQGVTVLLDPRSFLDAGRTGVPLVDLWLTTVNPKGRRRSAAVWSPELPDAQRLSPASPA